MSWNIIFNYILNSYRTAEMESCLKNFAGIFATKELAFAHTVRYFAKSYLSWVTYCIYSIQNDAYVTCICICNMLQL